MNEIQELKRALLYCNKELVVKGIGVFKPSYKAASLSSDGRTIVQPRYGWSFCLGSPAFVSATASTFTASETLASKLLANSEKGESFEIPGLGLFYKQVGCYELMPEPGHLIGANQHYGLMPLSVNKIRTVLPSELSPSNVKSVTPSNTILKAAAVFLGFLLLSMVAFQYLSSDGQLFLRQEAGMNIFSPERETLYQAPLIRERSSNIEDILEGINQVADSVMYERAVASETAAMYIDSLSKIAPIMKLDSDIHLKRNVFGNQKLDERKIEKQGKPLNKQEIPVVSKAAESKPPVQSSTKVSASAAAPAKVLSAPQPSSDNKSANSKNNLAKGLISAEGVDKKTKKTDSVSGQASTFIVVGSFQSLENAEKYKAELRSKGFQIAENKSILVGKLHRVVVFSPSSTISAEDFLAKAQNEISPGVWILKD
ncbi:MAG: SPOR domain-containing protein [Sphingobacteriaceae bacterium]|nr:SPOR domain-containing protein [Sphingobacteriaceae bacterium]